MATKPTTEQQLTLGFAGLEGEAAAMERLQAGRREALAAAMTACGLHSGLTVWRLVMLVHVVTGSSSGVLRRSQADIAADPWMRRDRSDPQTAPSRRGLQKAIYEAVDLGILRIRANTESRRGQTASDLWIDWVRVRELSEEGLAVSPAPLRQQLQTGAHSGAHSGAHTGAQTGAHSGAHFAPRSYMPFLPDTKEYLIPAAATAAADQDRSAAAADLVTTPAPPDRRQDRSQAVPELPRAVPDPVRPAGQPATSQPASSWQAECESILREAGWDNRAVVIARQIASQRLCDPATLRGHVRTWRRWQDKCGPGAIWSRVRDGCWPVRGMVDLPPEDPEATARARVAAAQAQAEQERQEALAAAETAAAMRQWTALPLDRRRALADAVRRQNRMLRACPDDSPLIVDAALGMISEPTGGVR